MREAYLDKQVETFRSSEPMVQNAMIAATVMGWRLRSFRGNFGAGLFTAWMNEEGEAIREYFRPSKVHEDAFKVWLRMEELEFSGLLWKEDDRWTVCFWRTKKWTRLFARAETVPMAICEAAIRAVSEHRDEMLIQKRKLEKSADTPADTEKSEGREGA